MDKKLEATMDVLKTYCTDSRAVKCREEEFVTIRSSIQKVTAIVNNSDQRDSFFANESYSQTIVYALQVLPDRLTRVFIIKLLFRLLRKAGAKKYALVLVQKGLTRALFQALYSESTEATPSEEFMIHIHQLLCRIGHLDKRFGVRARISQCLQITLGLLRAQIALLGTYAPTSALTFATVSTPTNAAPANGQSHNTSNSVNLYTAYSGYTGSGFCSQFIGTGHSPGTNNSVGTVSNPYAGAVIAIPNSLNRSLKTVLRTLRLYVVCGAGRMNASILGRSGVIALLIRLLTIVAGLPAPKPCPGHLSPTISPKSSNTVTNAAISNSSTIGPVNQNTLGAQTGGQSASTGNSGTNNAHGSSIGVVLTNANPPVPGLTRTGTENGLIIGSPIVTAVTATASAAAALHRHRLQNSTRRPAKNENNYTRAVDAGGVAILLDLFLDVHRCDLHGRRIPLQRSSLACLKSLTVSRAGRKLFINSGGLHTLFAVCAGYVGPDPFGRIGLAINFSNSKSGLDSGSLLGSRPGKPVGFRRPGRAAASQGLLRSSDTSTASATGVSGCSSPQSQKGKLVNCNAPCVPSSAPLSCAPQATAAESLTTLSSSAAGDNGAGVPCRFPSSLNKSEGLISILSEACLLLRRCCPRSRLPVTGAEGILRCPLPRESSVRTNADAHSKRDPTISQDADRTVQSESKGLKDRSFATDCSMLSNVSSTKRDEKRSGRHSPRIKDSVATDKTTRLSSTYYTDDNQSDTGVPSEITELSTSNVPSPTRRTDTSEPLVPVREPVKRRSGQRKRTLDASRDLALKKPVAKLSPARRSRTRKSKGNQHVPSKLQLPLGSAVSSSSGSLPKNCSNAPFSSSRSRSRRLRSHNKSTLKTVRGVDDRAKKTSNSTSQFTPILISNSVKLQHSPTIKSHHLHFSPCESPVQSNRSPSPVSAATESTPKRHSSEGEESCCCDSPPTYPPPPVSPERRSPSPVVVLDTVDDDEDDPDDDDDDDGEDDLDEDERNQAVNLSEAQPTDPRSIVADLIKTHGLFFPEWIDIPQEAPEYLTKEQLIPNIEPHVAAWPFINTTASSSASHDQTVSAKDGVKFDLNDTSSETDTITSFANTYLNHVRYTQTLFPLQTVAYPDLLGASYAPYVEPFYNRISDILSGADSLISSGIGGPEGNGLGCQDASESIPSHLGTDSILEDPPSSVHVQIPRIDTGRKGLSKSLLDHRSNSTKISGGRRSSTGTTSVSQSPRSSASRRISKSTGNLQKLSLVERPPPRLPYSLTGLPHVEILDDVRRLIDPDDLLNRTVFDLDDLILTAMRESANHQQPQPPQYVEFQPRSNSPRAHNLFPHQPVVKTHGSESDVATVARTSPSLLANAQSSSSVCVSSDPSVHRAPLAGSNILSPTPVRSSTSSSQHYSSVCVYGPELEFSGPHVDCAMTNEDETQINHFDMEKGHLEFESRFESGNLRKAIQVRQYEYDLILNPDVNTISNLQWFYFRVSNVEADVDYRFNIINCEKPSSQFTSGMQPLLFSVREALDGRCYWRRAGKCINYYRNHFVRTTHGKRVADGNTYHTTTFTIQFPHTGDVCYLAYHYPYTYTRLLADISRWHEQSSSGDRKLYFRVQQLTRTILENPVPVITITEFPDYKSEQSASLEQQNRELKSLESSSVQDNAIISDQKPYIFLTARVHSGESNSSWVMQGLIDRLVSSEEKMVQLRRTFIFKIVPMLNPDGVICGNHRCSMAGKDLNRRWINPSVDIHPTIYHTRKLLQLLHACERQPYIYIDFHGHSRMKNIFIYGCSPLESWKSPDLHNPTYRSYGRGVEDRSYRHLAELLDNLAPAFANRSCLYSVNRAKENAARIAVWREFSVVRSYTIEASYCGVTRNLDAPQVDAPVNSDPLARGHQINPGHLGNFGAQLLDAFLLLPAYDLEHPAPPTSPPPVLVDSSISSFPEYPALAYSEKTPDVMDEDAVAVERDKQAVQDLLSPQSDSSGDSDSSLSSVSVSSAFSLSSSSSSNSDNPPDG
ncbi:hypothetical protein CRM22_001901 [Opisthorchis felineus]|uniref:Peptidase M14 domain-containing protein n=1 Tax=Opisthorchis felineus TaxID=147828 RepID=A0A4V3SGK7_OPIFE|nr:hypothetical protein CRM22_001901 [Opisthorchis felineus]